MTKFTLQALALTGILAVSGLPAFAADMTAPVVSAPNASVSTGTKANVGTSIDKTKGSVDKNADKSKASTAKKIDKQSKNTKDKLHQQTAAKPATPAVPSVGSSAGANSSAGATVQH
jgi:hypothetical protein